jgi:hypothetical protein
LVNIWLTIIENKGNLTFFYRLPCGYFKAFTATVRKVATQKATQTLTHRKTAGNVANTGLYGMAFRKATKKATQ